MASHDQFLRALAAWALVHETADEGWKAAVTRGESGPSAGMGADPGTFVDGLSALISQEKERLKRELASGEAGDSDADWSRMTADVSELRFEVAELRGRLESMQVSLDTLLRRTE